MDEVLQEKKVPKVLDVSFGKTGITTSMYHHLRAQVSCEPHLIGLYRLLLRVLLSPGTALLVLCHQRIRNFCRLLKARLVSKGSQRAPFHMTGHLKNIRYHIGHAKGRGNLLYVRMSLLGEQQYVC